VIRYLLRKGASPLPRWLRSLGAQERKAREETSSRGDAMRTISNGLTPCDGGPDIAGRTGTCGCVRTRRAVGRPRHMVTVTTALLEVMQRRYSGWSGMPARMPAWPAKRPALRQRDAEPRPPGSGNGHITRAGAAPSVANRRGRFCAALRSWRRCRRQRRGCARRRRRNRLRVIRCCHQRSGRRFHRRD